MRVGYLNSEYPSVTHTFIEREIRAVRAAGVEVVPYSVRIPSPSAVRGEAAEAARAETRYILSDPVRVLLDVARAVFTQPTGLVRAIRQSQRMAIGGLGDRFRHLAYVAEAARLVRMLRADGVRHVHVHMANNGAAIALLGGLIDPSIEYSLTVHGPQDFYDVHRLQMGLKAERAVFVRCISNFCRSQMMVWCSPSAWPGLHVVPMGLDPEQFPVGSEREETGQLRLLAIGRMHAIKGHLLLIDALAQAIRGGVDASLDLVGDGPLKGDVERRVASLGIGDRVRLHGARPVEEIPRFVAEADLMVISSFNEGVPTVLMEAMAAGCLVLSTRVGGVAELVDDQESSRSGFLVDAGSVDSLADGLRQVAATSPEARREIRRRARETVLKRYDVWRNGSAVAELLRGCG